MFQCLSSAWIHKTDSWDLHQDSSLKYGFLTFFVLAFLCYFLIVGIMPVRNTMEARNFKTAEEILESNEWLLPTLNNELRILKPPLPTWCVAGIIYITNCYRNLWVMRFPNLCVAFLLIFFVWLFVKELFNTRTAFFATMMIATTITFWGDIFVARWDMFACSFGMGGLYFLANVFKYHKVKYVVGAIFCYALSYLSKGPAVLLSIIASFYISFFIFLLWNHFFPSDLLKSWCEKYRKYCPHSIKAWILFIGIIFIALIIGNSWWLFIKFNEPEAWKQIFSDLESLGIKHSEPFYYYLLLSTGYIGIWSLFLLISYALPIAFIFKKYRIKLCHDNFLSFLFTWTWFLIGILFISFISAKKNRYFLIILPICIIMTANCCEYLLTCLQRKEKWSLYLIAIQKLALVLAFSCCGVAIIVGLFLGTSFWSLLAIPCCLLLAFFMYKGHVSVSKVIAETAFGALFVIVVVFFILQSAGVFYDRYPGAYEVTKLTGDQKLYIFGEHDDKVLWAIGREAIFVTDDSEKNSDSETLPDEETFPDDEPYFLLVPNEFEAKLWETQNKEDYKEIYTFYEVKTHEKNLWTLYNVHGAKILLQQ